MRLGGIASKKTIPSKSAMMDQTRNAADIQGSMRQTETAATKAVKPYRLSRESNRGPVIAGMTAAAGDPGGKAVG